MLAESGSGSRLHSLLVVHPVITEKLHEFDT